MMEQDRGTDMTAISNAAPLDAAPRILVIEDEPLIAMGIKLMLESLGYAVHAIVDNEGDAIAEARSSQLDLILADVRLKAGGDGITAVKQILSERDIPVLFLTGNPADLEERGMGHMNVLSKPFMPAMLERAVRRMIPDNGRKVQTSEPCVQIGPRGRE